MTAFLNSTPHTPPPPHPPPPPPPPPRYRLTQNLTLAWLRLGKAAVFGVLAGLAVAAGLAFPGGDAQAQGYGGYTYTARVCQEYGQQPRWYNVRDGQAAYNGGNSDSGWLLVLERGANVFPAQYEFSSPLAQGFWPNAQAGLNGALTETAHRLFAGPATNAYGLANGEAIIASDGTRGFVTRVANLVAIDRDDSGMFDVGDFGEALFGGVSGEWSYETRTYTRTAAAYNYGAQYVRWAHMMWCR